MEVLIRDKRIKLDEATRVIVTSCGTTTTTMEGDQVVITRGGTHVWDLPQETWELTQEEGSGLLH
jgi:hypothetical protein